MSRADLDSVALLRFMPDDVRRLVEESFADAHFDFGDVILREGDPADALYAIKSGHVRVIATAPDGREVPLNLLGPGASFGEVGLLDGGGVRTASVRASSEVEASRLDGAVFRALAGIYPEIRTAAELAARERALHGFLRLRSAFGDLAAPALATLLAELEEIAVSAGDTVISEGDPPGGMYIVREGRLVASVAGRPAGAYGPGDFFGESSLLLGRDRSATVRADGDGRLLHLTPDAFARLAASEPSFHERVALEAARHGTRRLRTGADVAPEELQGPVTRDVPAADLPDELPGTRSVANAPAGRRRRRFPLVWGTDEMDCGAACVTMVCRAFGRRVGLSHVREAVRTGVDGTSLHGIAIGAAELGLDVRTVKASKRNLDALPLPAIVHWDLHHWVVAYSIRGDTIRIADPAIGLRRLSREEFVRRWSGYAALLAPAESFAEAPEEASGVRWLAPFFRPHRGLISVALVLALVVSALQLALPVATQVVIDRVLPHTDIALLHIVLAGLAAAVAITAVVSIAQRYLLAQVALHVDRTSLDAVAAQLLSLPMRYFFARRVGDIQRRLSGVRQAREFVVRGGVAGITAGAQLVTAIVLMFVYSRVLAAAYLVGLPVAAALMLVAARRVRPIQQNLEDSFGRYYSRQIDALKGMETVKVLGAERALRASLVAEFEVLSERLLRADLLSMLYDGSVQLLTFVLLGVFLWLGSLQVLSGHLTLGAMVSFSALVALANGPMAVLLMLWDEGQLASVLLDRISDVFGQAPEQYDRRDTLRPVSTLSGHIELRGVTFRFGGADETPILDELNLKVVAGTNVAIVGRSGSGKTTLARCLTGLLEPSVGQILYDGVDMTTLDYRQLRRHIGCVLQENFLFSDTIAANIAFGEGEPDMDRVVWSAQAASAHDFIRRLPLGYDTRVGDTGLLLSGGQRQRIAIARAVYGQPPVLVLDEATSSLDAESERAVKKSMNRLLAGRTSFVIAHRLSTIRDADLIVVLDAGRLVEQGTHDQLMARRGLYHYLASEQLEI